jgi:SAM-dependent methyltransferase
MINISFLYTRIRQRGVAGTTREGWNILRSAFARADAFDRARGTDTSREKRLWGLKVNSSNLIEGGHYQTCDPAFIENTLRSLRIDFSAFTFLDLGCGKGRPLMIAAMLGFRRVLGVDFCPELCVIARKNLQMARLAGDVLYADVCEIQIPDGAVVIYLYNPFGPKVMRRVCENLNASLRSKPRPCFILYINPLHAEVFDLAGFTRCGGNEHVAIWHH